MSDEAEGRATSEGWLAWACVGLTAWIVAGIVLVNWAINQGLIADVGFSPWHVPAYTGLAAMTVFGAALAVRGRRSGRRWRDAMPPGYGVLGAGILVGLAYPIADVAWREGVGPIDGVANSFAPSRLLIPIAITLMAAAPIRVAARERLGLSDRWAAVVATALIAGSAWFVGGFHPALSPWLERAPLPATGDTEIWTMLGDGRQQTRVIEADATHGASWASWSPDQTRIAFTRWTALPDGQLDADVWVANADGSDPHVVVGGPGWQWIPHWSPDGTRIAFTQEANGGPWMATGPTGPDVAPGPQGPAFGDPAATRSHAALWIAAADGSGQPVQVTDGSSDDRAAAFSPDGTRLVFDSTRDGNTELYLVNVDGSNPVRLTNDPADDWGGAWSPDGTRIAFNSGRTGSLQIDVLPATGGDPVRLTNEPGYAREPIWSPDGTRIAYESVAPDSSTSSIYVIGVDGTDRRDVSRVGTVTDSLGGSTQAWGRDGRIVFTREPALPATWQPIVREDLAVAAMLLSALVIVVLAVVLARTAPPFGAYAFVFGVGVLIVAVAGGNLRFVPAAIVAGLVVDVLARLAPARLVPQVAGAASGAVFVISAMAAVAATTGLGWQPGLVLGVPIAAGVVGWAVGAVLGAGVTRAGEPASESAPA